MASNGYVRRCCSGCIFYYCDQEFGSICSVKSYDYYKWDFMRWVSATLYDADQRIKCLHDEPCEHFVNLGDLRREYRQKFGFEPPREG